MRRPSAYAPLSVLFATSKTGAAIQDKHGVEGIGVWACMIAAAKRGTGQIVFAHDQDWQAIGLLEPPKFTLSLFLKTTGQLKQTRTTRHGHVLYVQLTRYEDWNDDAHRERERQRKASKTMETQRNKNGSEAEGTRNKNAPELELDLELEHSDSHVVEVPDLTPEDAERLEALHASGWLTD